MRVVSYRICPFVQRVTATLAAKGLAHGIDYISLSDKPGWFLALSPTGQVPVLVTDGGRALFESDAIVEYLDEVAPPLTPDLSPEDRAEERAWSTQAAKHYLVQCGAMQSPDRETLARKHAALDRAFARVGARLGDGPFFAGARPGKVDLAWLVLLHRAAIVERRTGHDLLAGHPKVKAWQGTLMATGLAERSVAGDFETAFAALYLSPRTWLGREAGATAAPVAEAGCGSCC